MNDSGESDCTGSMVGQLLGAAHGIDAIPADWLARRDGRDVVETIAKDFAVRVIDPRALEWVRYPGG